MTKTDLATVATPPTDLAVGPNMNNLLELAIAKGDEGTQTLERIMDLLERNQANEARAQFNSAMAAFAAECPPIKKNKTANIVTKSGSRYSYSYATLDQIARTVSPILSKLSLSYTWNSKQGDGQLTCTATIRHAAGHSESSEFVCPIERSAQKSGPQNVASSLTYARRQALVMALGLSDTEDDIDGQEAGPEVKANAVSEEQALQLEARCNEAAEHKGKDPGYVLDRMLKWASASSLETFPKSKFAGAMKHLDGMFK